MVSVANGVVLNSCRSGYCATVYINGFISVHDNFTVQDLSSTKMHSKELERLLNKT